MTKQCVVCAETIALNAKKCVQCDSFQNWRRHLNFSSSVISLLIALISVTALSAGHVARLFESSYSDLRVALLNTSQGKVSLLVSNDGNKSGAMKFGELEVYDSRFGTTDYEMVPHDGIYIVSAGEVKQVDLVFRSEQVNIRHRSWLSEGIQGNNWNKEMGFHSESTLQIILIQYSAFKVVFDAQQSDPLVENDQSRTSKTTSYMDQLDSDSVELRISSYDIFPWLWKDQIFTITADPK